MNNQQIKLSWSNWDVLKNKITEKILRESNIR